MPPAVASAGRLPGSRSSPRPQKPTATPASVPRCTRSRPMVERMSTSHSGTEAMSSAASPAGTSRSATVTRPLPPAGSSRPTSPAAARLRGATRTRCPRAARNASMATPAIAKRAPAPSSGGTSSTITRMAT